MFQHVLVPLDGSPQADTILPYVTALARQLRMAITPQPVADPPAAAPPCSMPRDVSERLPLLTGRLSDLGVPTATAVAIGGATKEILRIADDRRCDLIALSTSTGSSSARS